MAFTKTNNSRAVTKKDENAVMKKMTPEKLKNCLNDIAYVLAGAHPEMIMQEFNEKLLPQVRAGEKLSPQMVETIINALMVHGLDTHYPITETVAKRYRPLVIEFSRQLIQEYDCKTASEKALAQVVVTAYARILEYSNKLNNCIAQQWLMDDRLNYFSRLSKEVDRAGRQFITALTTLKQIKTPPLEVNVKAKAAFVAQNQQVNINPSHKDENIEPK